MVIRAGLNSYVAARLSSEAVEVAIARKGVRARLPFEVAAWSIQDAGILQESSLIDVERRGLSEDDHHTEMAKC